MGSSKIVVCLLLALQLTSCLSATIEAKGNNSLLFKSEYDELSADALNVRVNFQPYDETWDTFKTTFGRQYKDSTEEDYRKGVFVDNVKKIEVHNAKFHKGETTFWMGINQFTDMTLEEYIEYNHLYPLPREANASVNLIQCSRFVNPRAKIPPSLDWRTLGYVTPVKDQETCGSCWAFSATGAVEGQYYRKTKKLVSLSEQQLVACSKANSGCKGGRPDWAFVYINSAGGIQSQWSYPYENKNGTCKFSRPNVVTTVSGCRYVSSGSEIDLQAAVVTQGPVSVLIDASHNSFRDYSGGVVYNEPACSSRFLNHAVLVVGYGTWNGLSYWLVKNSWGTPWGDKGYIMMARNRNNMCGIASYANFPLI